MLKFNFFLRRHAHGVGRLAAGLLATLVVAAMFPSVLAHPDDFFFLNAGDGLKAYFAILYYVKYDAGLHFTGMNYPFGEHINYPDMQPLVSGTMLGLQRLGIPVVAHGVGIINLVALAGLVLAVVVLYSILRRTRLPVWYAVLMALLIGFMSPQIERLGGHMSLSYACFVPFLWYCLLRIQEAPLRGRWYVVMGVSSLLMAGTSAYFLACGSLFVLAHAAVLAWQQRRPGPVLWRLALAALLPLLVYRSWLWFTDPVLDRPENPYGFLLFLASPATVFLPVMPPLGSWWHAQFQVEETGFEGWAYVGLAATAVALAAGAGLLKQLGRRQWGRLLRPALPLQLRTGLWAAGLLLLLAFGWPFKFAAFGWLTDHSGPVKQFRALGRFAWPFFYVFSVYAAYYLFRLWRGLRQRGAGAFRQAWFGLPLLVWGAEAYVQIHAKAEVVEQRSGAVAFMNPANNPAVQLLSWSNRSRNDFQAILTLPYFAVGTDKTDLSGTEACIDQSFRAALALGLPLVATSMSRSSVGQTLQHLQLFSHPWVEKHLLRQLPSSKPFLLLVTPDALTPAEQRLVGRARKLVSTPEVTLYELPLAALAATPAQTPAQVQALLPTLTARGRLFSSTGKGAVLETFDQRPDRRGRLAPGAFFEPENTFSTLYEGPLPLPADTGRYEAAVWMWGRVPYGYGNMQVKVFGAAGEMLDFQITDARHATEVLGDWVRVEVPFRRTAQATRVQVLYDNRALLADDLLIRPLDTDVYYYNGPPAAGKLVKNTYPLTP